MNIRRILLPTDFSPAAEHALHWALHIARALDATLHLMHVMADHNPEWFGAEDVAAEGSPARERLEEEAREELEQVAIEAEKSGVSTRRTIEYDLNVADAILEVAREEEVDLIVTGTHGRKGLTHLILGSVAEKVVRRAPQPVLTVGRKAPDPPAIRRILAPVDFSEPSKEALRLAKDVAAAFEAQLDLLFVAEERTVPVFSDTGIPRVNTIQMDPEIVKDAARALEQLNGSVGGPDVNAHGHVAEGDVSKRIVHFAETHDTGLIVLATRGLAGLDRLLIGSVTQRVMRTAPCPVLTLNARPREGELEN